MNVVFQLEGCEILGTGAEGSVYLTPEGYVLKTFKSRKSAIEEAYILNEAKDSIFFPDLFLQTSNLIIREYVDGETLFKYLEKNDLPEKISYQIIDFIEDLKKLGFKRLNIRNAHIFINDDAKLMVIDPRKSFTKYTPYPKDIIKVLLKLKLFDKFLSHLSDYKPQLLSYWIKGYEYVAENNRVSRYM